MNLTLLKPISVRARRRGSRCPARERDPGSPRPADVIVAHFVAALAFLLAAGVVALIHQAGGIDRGRWLALHLALIGGVSQLVLAAAEFFAGAFFATDQPRRVFVRFQLVCWNLGALMVPIGVMEDSHLLVEAGALALLLGLGAFAGALIDMQRRSLQNRTRMVRWYYTCATFFVIGMLAGVAMATGRSWTSGDLLSAHVTLMLGGWLGTAIFGTLHTFYPSIFGTQLRFPRLEAPTYWCWVAGVACVASGYGFGVTALAVAGWVVLCAAATLLAVNLAAMTRSGSPAHAGAVLVATAQLLLVLGMVLATVTAASNAGATIAGADRAAVAALLLGGWIALTVLGSLVQLLAVVARVRNLMAPPPRVWLPPAVAVVAAAGCLSYAAGELAGVDAVTSAAKILLVLAYATAGLQAASLAVKAARAAPIGI